MTKQLQRKKNFDLAEKLADFLVKNPDPLGDTPKNTSYVVLSSADKKLNKENERLIQSVLEEGKYVVKAQQTTDKHNPWKFTPVSQ